MKRLATLLLAMVLVVGMLLIPDIGAAAPDYKALYEESMATAQSWQDQAFVLSAEIARQKQLIADALKLLDEAEADVDDLQEEVTRLTAEITARDAIIEAQAKQLKSLMGVERFLWLIGGILAGAAGGIAGGIAINKLP